MNRDRKDPDETVVVQADLGLCYLHIPYLT